MSACPMIVTGATVTTEDTQGGIAMVFTTKRGNVDELRQRVRRMAEMHNRHHGGGQRGRGMRGRGMGPMMMIDSTATVEAVPGGARITFTAREPRQVDELRGHLRQRAARMAAGHCPRMQARRGYPALSPHRLLRPHLPGTSRSTSFHGRPGVIIRLRLRA